jgi:hypothetical protein
LDFSPAVEEKNMSVIVLRKLQLFGFILAIQKRDGSAVASTYSIEVFDWQSAKLRVYASRSKRLYAGAAHYLDLAFVNLRHYQTYKFRNDNHNLFGNLWAIARLQ